LILALAGTLRADTLPPLYSGDNKMNVLVLPKPFTLFSTPSTRQDAFRAAKKFVQARIQHPKDAFFADKSSSTIQPLGNDTFKITSEWGYIAEDGSAIETNWTAKVYYHRADKRWYLLALTQTLPD
jgi:hypothetical protein